MNYSFEYIDIILLAMIAGFIFLRLRGILGKRTGFEGKINPQFENVKKSVNEFEVQLQKDKELKQQVNTTNSTYTNGARFGMIFNNTIELFIANGMKWTTGEFIDNFRRVEGWVEACENPSTTPLNTQPNEPIPNGIQETVVVNEDDLPF